MPVTLKTGKLKYKNSQGQYVDIGAVGIQNSIDDTAGSGDTDKVWSADKAASEVSDKQVKPSTQGTAGQVLSLDSNLSPVWATPSGGGTSMLVPNIWWNTYENKYVCSETYGNIAQAVQEQRCCFGTFEDTDILYLMDRSLYGIRFVKTSVGTNGINSCEFYIANDNEITRTDLGFGIGSVIAGIEEHTTASRAYSVGDLFLWYYEGDGTFLYKATESIAVGDELESEVNCTQVTIAEELADLKTYVDNAIPSVPVQDVQINGTSILSNGIANVPVASANGVGVAKVSSAYGTSIHSSSGTMQIYRSQSEDVKNGANAYRPIVPSNQHESAFYGLAKAAGADMASSSNPVGTFTDEAKIAIQKMLGIYEAPWELIREDTFTNATEANIDINIDSNGNPFELTDILCTITIPTQDTDATITDYGLLYAYYGETDKMTISLIGANPYSIPANSSQKISLVDIRQSNGLAELKCLQYQNETGRTNVQMAAYSSQSAYNPFIYGYPIFNKISIRKVTGTFGVKLYGKRKWS